MCVVYGIYQNVLIGCHGDSLGRILCREVGGDLEVLELGCFGVIYLV